MRGACEGGRGVREGESINPSLLSSHLASLLSSLPSKSDLSLLILSCGMNEVDIILNNFRCPNLFYFSANLRSGNPTLERVSPRPSPPRWSWIPVP